MKISHMALFGLVLSFVSLSVQADSVDNFIRSRLKLFDITPYEKLPENKSDDYIARVELGRRLFIDTNISGNRQMSCLQCHRPGMGTSDGLPLSQSENGQGVLRRNASSLYNIGDKFNTFMFWDGRVRFQPGLNIFTTPEPALNGVKPKASQITSVLKSALSAQSIFPLVAHDEMMGEKGQNEIADAKDNVEAWDRIMKRITTEDQKEKYISLFNRAYPEVGGDVQKLNIGHAGEAMGTFMREFFQSNTSPFHRYVAGDDTAMTAQQKRGFLVFMEEGKCIACHSGNLLGNNSFFASVGVPQYGAKPFKADIGRGEVNNEKFRSFFFKVPSLINVKLSAPYYHNGAFKTIREVLVHYNNIEKSLANYDASKRQDEFPVPVENLNSPQDINEILTSIEAGFLRNGLNMSSAQLDDLEVFLKEALTDPKWGR